MKKLKVNVLTNVNPGPAPSEGEKGEKGQEAVEHQIVDALSQKGHSVDILPVTDSAKEMCEALTRLEADIVFNLCEAFRNNSQLEMHVAALLELLGIKYTGCGPQGLLLGQNKSLTKQILAYHGIKSPQFAVYPMGPVVPRPSYLRFPLIVKPLKEDASIGISLASIVKSDEPLRERIEFIHEKLQQEAIVEEYIEGREFCVGVWGNERAEVLPLIELDFANVPENRPRIYSFKAKWDALYREEKGIRSIFVKDLSEIILNRIQDVCVTTYRALGFKDYARLDIRMTHDYEIYVLDANPNPYIAKDEDLPMAAEKAGVSYGDFVGRILQLAWERYRS